METLKQTAITAISQLPDTANIDDIQTVFQRLERKAKQIPDETEGISCYDLAKDLLGSGEGPEDLSTNKAYLEGVHEATINYTRYGAFSSFHQSSRCLL